ncbi:MAG: phospholipase A [Pseudomonadota bacterium]
MFQFLARRRRINSAAFYSGAMGQVSLLMLLLAMPPVHADVGNDCLLRQVHQSSSETTIGEIRAACEREREDNPTVSDVGETLTEFERGTLRERISAETSLENSGFSITPHFPNFIQYSTFEANQAPFESISGIPNGVEDQEAVFQVSFKAPVWRRMLGTDLSTYFAYTSRSWWQVANDNFSSPFRETNYMPEVFVRSVKQRNVLGLSLEGWSLGFVHESNGREQALSRSWNRVMGRFGLQLTDDVSLLGQVWYRIPDDDDEDDNPREYRFYGYGDVRAVWTPGKHTLTALARPGTQETSFELTWSYPINRVFRVYAGYYNGYGESLLDYDFDTERVSVGIALNDFLTAW